MTQPEPTVVLDDLGDSALMFSLRYWIRLGAGTDGREVDSDLRCEILDKLAAAGIDVPYPQRDVRLQMAQPLTVALMHPDSETKGR
jgi:small-conductance mechanosensitive channel